MRIERKQGLTKREFLAGGGLALVGFLLPSDSNLAIEEKKQTGISKKDSNFLGEWRGFLASLLCAVGVRKTFSKAKGIFSPLPQVDDNQPLKPLYSLNVERRVKDLRERLGKLKVDKKLIKKQLRFLERSYKGRAVRVLNNPNIIPFGREGEWIFLIDSGLYCARQARNLCEKGDLFGASLFLAIADDDRLILNKESFNWQFDESFKLLREQDIEQQTYRYSKPTSVVEDNKNQLEPLGIGIDIRDEVDSAFIFHTQMCKLLRDCLRNTVEKSKKLDRDFLSRIFFTEVSIVELLQKYLDYKRTLKTTGEMSQVEGQREELDREFSNLLTNSINYDLMSNREVLLLLWRIQRAIDKFISFDNEFNSTAEEGKEEVRSQKEADLVI